MTQKWSENLDFSYSSISYQNLLTTALIFTTFDSKLLI